MSRRHHVAAIAAGAALIATGCSAEGLAEKVIEKQIESAADGEVDVDVDFDGDGGISIKTPDGEFQIQTDGDGNVSMQGSGQDGEGSFVAGQTTKLPDDFPSDVPIPDGFDVLYAQRTETPEGLSFAVVANSSRAVDDIIADLVSGLESNGFTQQQITTTPDGSMIVYGNADYTVHATVGTSAEGSGISLGVLPITGG